MAIESMLQQTSVFVDSMNVKSPTAEKTADENAQEAKTPDQGDSVTISEEARALAAMSKTDDSSETKQEKDMDQTIQKLQEQIEQIEQEIADLRDKQIPEDQKQTQIQGKEVQLMELRKQLAEAQQTKLKADGQASGGGTRAQGFGNSVSTF